MADPIDSTLKNLQIFIPDGADILSIPYASWDDPKKKAVGILRNMGIHVDYIAAAMKGEPYGAKVIDLDEYRWMRKLDDL